MGNTKQLIIVRHGKAADEYDVTDIDRHLREKGIKDSYIMAERIKEKGILPEQILSSTAPRALHTALIFARTFNVPAANIRLTELIYEGDEHEILNFIRRLRDDFSSLMIFGHNPMFTDLANLFLKDKLDKLPTAGVAVVNFETDSWANISGDNVTSEMIDYPKKTEKNN